MTDPIITERANQTSGAPKFLSRRFATAEEILGAEKFASFLEKVTEAFEEEVDLFTADLTGNFGLDNTQAAIVMHETLRKVFHLDEEG